MESLAGLKMLSNVDRGVFLYLEENENDSFSSKQLDRLTTQKSTVSKSPIAMDRRLQWNRRTDIKNSWRKINESS